MFCTLYTRKHGLTELAEAELGHLSAGHSPEVGIWLSESPIAWAQTGFGKGGGRLIASGETLEAFEADLLAQALSPERMGITVWRVPRAIKGGQRAKRLVADCIDSGVDFADPTLRLGLVVSRAGFHLFEEGEAGDAAWFGARDKPQNLPVGLSTRVARSMLNLTVAPGESVLDPFCGSGTIPLVAALSGHPAAGSDISWQIIEKAKENVAHFGQAVSLCREDARTQEGRADAVVTNLPYGIRCELAPGALHEVLRRMKASAPRVTLITPQPLREVLAEEGFELRQVVTLGDSRFDRFIYLTG